MIPEQFLNNLVAWAAQVLLVVSIGALLPIVLRIRHPHSHLVYCHLLLVISVVLPFIQPWHEPVAVSGTTAAVTSTLAVVREPSPAPAAVSWDRLLLAVLGLGIVIRLCWLVAGLRKINTCHRLSRPFESVPQSIMDARRIAHTDDAIVRIAPGDIGPVTFGFFRPIILLPESFLDLDEDAQRAIVCHELLHVRRRDWLVTLLEEVIGAVLWFHPAVWWLLAQTRLSREQLVDAEVVRLTAAREPYMKALLAIARSRLGLDLAPASLFLRRRHLTKRMHFLLSEVPMSRLRLLCSYVSIAGIVAVAAWAALSSFPLIGQAEAQQPTAGYVVNRVPAAYPAEARARRIEGTVVVEVGVNNTGQIIDTRVISGPEELRQAALQTALQGNYGVDVARTLQVIVDFKLPPAPNVATASARSGPVAPNDRMIRGQDQTLTENGQVSGTISDPSGNLLPGGRVVLTTASNTRILATTSEVGAYRVSIPAGSYKVSAEAPGFQAVTYDAVVLAPRQQARLNFSLKPPSPSLEPPVAQDTIAPRRLRIGGNVLSGKLIAQVNPVYPPQARDMQIEGVVLLEAVIDIEGRVASVRVVSGNPMLVQSAVDAVSQWVYQPVLLNGQPVEAITTVTVNFSLQ